MKLNLFNTSVDSILSTFTKTIAKLDAHAVSQQTKADKKRDDAKGLMAKAMQAEIEANKARAASSKLNNFFKEE